MSKKQNKILQQQNELQRLRIREAEEERLLATARHMIATAQLEAERIMAR